jgi:hypothetical protein
MASARPLEIFYSYAHEDEDPRDMLDRFANTECG